MKKILLLIILTVYGSSTCFAYEPLYLLPEIAFNFQGCYSTHFQSCDSYHQIVGTCDNRNPGPGYSTKGQSPWHSVGVFVSPSCTGTLISPKHVLTAAHCIINRNHVLTGNQLGFNLGQYVAAGTSTKMRPYGTHYAKRVFVPTSYIPNSNSGSESVKVYDYAVVELNTALPTENVLSPPITQIDWLKLWGSKPYYSIGYPYDKTPGSVWGTAGYYKTMSFYTGGALLKLSIDGVGGQSGSPVYRFIDNKRTLIGVLIGSPASVCAQGGVTWTVFMTQWALDNVIWPSVYYNWFPFLNNKAVTVFNYPNVPQDTP